MKACTKTKSPQFNRPGTIRICIAMLLKYHYDKTCLVQKILSLVLYAGHSGKEYVCHLRVCILKRLFFRYISSCKRLTVLLSVYDFLGQLHHAQWPTSKHLIYLMHKILVILVTVLHVVQIQPLYLWPDTSTSLSSYIRW